mmetsp:Transcript_53308/g.141266  ORF Transcript_53308/g.141266 Transcript_53308/m.141266 type:complete len:1012 (-) Transcript_53308:919-3954(-)
MSFKGAAGATTPTAPAPHHFKGRPSLEIAAVVSRNATNTEVSAAGQINDQIRRVSLEMAKRLSEDNEGGKAEEQPKFTVSHGLSTSEAQVLLEKWGRNELVEKITPLWLVILRLLTGPMPIMLWIAAIIEGVIENFADMGILLGIQFINAAISFYETSKAGNAVAALKASLKPLATVKRDGKWQNMDAATIVPGDLVLLAAGSAVPADCYVNEGEIEVDQSAMTGESLPVKFRHGDVCKMGSTVTRGEVEGTVETTGQNTFFGKTAAMLQAVDGSGGSLQALLMQVMIVLVSLSLCLCSAAFIYLVVVGNRKNNDQTPEHQVTYEKIVKESLSFAVVVLVASIPLAVEIVTTTTLAMGSRMLSRDGAIVTRLASIESMAGMDMLCSDKTGTLTLNKMVIQDDCPTFTPNENKETVLFQAALAAKWKEPPRDALDTMVLKTGLKLPQGPKAPADGDAEGESAGPAEVVSQADLEEGQRNLDKLNTFTQIDFTPFDPRTKKTEGKLRGPDGNVFSIAKGAPHVILNMCANKEEIRLDVEKKVHELGTRGIRSLAVGRKDGEDGPWRLLGILTFLDPPRPDTKQTIADAKVLGVEVKMITGDHKVVAVETARQLGMGTLIQGPQGLPMLGEGGSVPPDLVDKYAALIVPSCGFAQVFPEHKYLIVECLRQVGYRCGMTGDGVNDAPALKRADVGIAVQGATDAARAASDIVLTHEGLSVCIEALKIAREIFARLKNFINYRISATLQLLVFFFIAVFALEPRVYYEKNGLVGRVLVSVLPELGGNPKLDFLKELQYFNIPRKNWRCPTGWDGVDDVRFKNFKRTLNVTVTTSTALFTTVYGSTANPETKYGPSNDVDSHTVTYFDVDSMKLRNPFWHGASNASASNASASIASASNASASFDIGCNILLPICKDSTTCPINGTDGCPPYQKCDAWPFFFQLPVLMLMLITLLNDGALISIGYDFVKPSPIPERWNFPLVFSVSCMLGAVACGSSLLLLWVGVLQASLLYCQSAC